MALGKGESGGSMMSSVFGAIGGKQTVKVRAKLLQRRDRFVPPDGRPMYMRYFPVIVLELTNAGNAETRMVRAVMNFKKQNSRVIDLQNGGLVLPPTGEPGHIQLDGTMLGQDITRIRLFDEHKHKYDVPNKILREMIRAYPAIKETIEQNNALAAMGDSQLGI